MRTTHCWWDGCEVQQQGSSEDISVDAQGAFDIPLYPPLISQGCREQEVGVDGTEQPECFCLNDAVRGLDLHDGYRDMHIWQDGAEQTVLKVQLQLD